MTRGILYVAWLGEYSDQTIMKWLKQSIYSLRKFCRLPITIRTNTKGFTWLSKFSFENVHIEDVVETPEKDGYKPKLQSCSNLPYDMTICCDADTLFYDNPEKLIDEEVDLSICRQQKWESYRRNEEPKVSKLFNTGFFIAKNSKPFKNLIKRAFKETEGHESDMFSDQRFINAAVDFSFDLTIKILPQQWNVNEVVFDSIEDVKIIHTKGELLNPIID